jgi:hypothetical protein
VGEELRLPATSPDGLDDRTATTSVTPGDDDVRSLGREPARYGAPDVAGRPGDQSDLALQTIIHKAAPRSTRPDVLTLSRRKWTSKSRLCNREAAPSDLISGVSPAAAPAVAHFLAVKSNRVRVCGPDWKTGEGIVFEFTGPAGRGRRAGTPKNWSPG